MVSLGLPCKHKLSEDMNVLVATRDLSGYSKGGWNGSTQEDTKDPGIQVSKKGEETEDHN